MSIVRRFLSQFWALLLLFAAWQIWVVSNDFNSIVILSPVAVLKGVFLHPSLYVPPMLWTLAFAIAGLAGGMACGVLLAIFCWRSQLFSAAINPSVLLLSSTPVVCIIPLLARIFGYHTGTEYVTVVIMTFFPCFVYAASGLRKLPSMSSEFFEVMAASKTDRLLYLALPAAVPNLAIALRVGAACSVLATMVAEYLMQTGGLGNMFALTSQAFQTERALGASLVAMALSVTLYSIGGVVEEGIQKRYT
jgi:ABC-type nitrate/sulfonate/bicarbonate transport system permease component